MILYNRDSIQTADRINTRRVDDFSVIRNWVYKILKLDLEDILEVWTYKFKVKKILTMIKYRNFAPTNTDLKEFMFVQRKGNELECFEVKVDDYDNKDSKILNGLVLEVTETKDEFLFTKKLPHEYVELDRTSIEGIPLLS